MKKILFLFLISYNFVVAQDSIFIKSGFPGHALIKHDSLYYSFGNYNVRGINRLFSHPGKIVVSKTIIDNYTVFSVSTIDTNVLNRKLSIPIKYRLLKYNCVHFVKDVVNITTPAFTPAGLKRDLSDHYVINSLKIAQWSSMFIAGALHGGREAYYADNTVFERNFGVDTYSFFGSRAWERKYETGRYLNEDGTKNKMKTQIFGNFGRDYWHTSKYINYAIYGTVVFSIGNTNQKFKYKLFDLLIASGCHSAGAFLTYNILRY